MQDKEAIINSDGKPTKAAKVIDTPVEFLTGRKASIKNVQEVKNLMTPKLGGAPPPGSL